VKSKEGGPGEKTRSGSGGKERDFPDGARGGQETGNKRKETRSGIKLTKDMGGAPGEKSRRVHGKKKPKKRLTRGRPGPSAQSGDTKHHSPSRNEKKAKKRPKRKTLHPCGRIASFALVRIVVFRTELTASTERLGDLEKSEASMLVGDELERVLKKKKLPPFKRSMSG